MWTRAMTVVLLGLAGLDCYPIALTPDARAHIGRIVVVECIHPLVTARRTVVVKSDDGRHWNRSGILYEASVSVLERSGFEVVQHPERRVFETRGILESPYPDDVCAHAREVDAATVLWLTPYLTWRPTAGGLVDIALTGHLIACPDGQLLWRDRADASVSIVFGPGSRPAEVVPKQTAYIDMDTTALRLTDLTEQLLQTLAATESPSP